MTDVRISIKIIKEELITFAKLFSYVSQEETPSLIFENNIKIGYFEEESLKLSSSCLVRLKLVALTSIFSFLKNKLTKFLKCAIVSLLAYNELDITTC